MPAKIDAAKCTGCGNCEYVCPSDAIVVDEVAIISDIMKCTDCGACVNECPEKGIEFFAS